MRIRIEYNDYGTINILIEYGNIWKELEEIYRENGYVKRTKPYLGQNHPLTCYTWLNRTRQDINMMSHGTRRIGIIDDVTEPPILSPLAVNVGMLRCIDADSPADNPRLTLTANVNSMIFKSDLDEIVNILLRRLKMITNRRMRYEIDMRISFT